MESREHSRTPSLPESSTSFGIDGRTQKWRKSRRCRRRRRPIPLQVDLGT